MPHTPYVSIDLARIEHNARTIVTLCAAAGIAVTGVTKGVCGEPEVARAMLRGGVQSIGESRMSNIERLRAGGVDAPFMLIRTPSLSRVEQVIENVPLSLNSELVVVRALAEEARRRGRVHDIIVMIDLGDLREGLWPPELLPFIRALADLPEIRVVGLGTSLSCYAGVAPNRNNMLQLLECAERVRREVGIELEIISGGASNALPLIAAGEMPAGISHVRVGEGILLGLETVHRRPVAGTFQDAFVLHAEVIELKRKPSIPIGERGEDAFGGHPVFVDRGLIDRAIVNAGRADINVDGVGPLDRRFDILGATSDHLLVDVTAAPGEVAVGDVLEFSMNYAALVTAMSSPYVAHRFVERTPSPGARRA